MVLTFTCAGEHHLLQTELLAIRQVALLNRVGAHLSTTSATPCTPCSGTVRSLSRSIPGPKAQRPRPARGRRVDLDVAGPVSRLRFPTEGRKRIVLRNFLRVFPLRQIISGPLGHPPAWLGSHPGAGGLFSAGRRGVQVVGPFEVSPA